MKIFSAAQIKAWDDYTINHEPIASIDLMERAASKCVDWILKKDFKDPFFKVFCGNGNNGGDGLAIARLLLSEEFPVSVYVIETGAQSSTDFEANLKKLIHTGCSPKAITAIHDFPEIKENDIIIEALLGAGLTRRLNGIIKNAVELINGSKSKVISIDIPAGMYVNTSSKGQIIIKADYTLTFQQVKPAFLVAENAAYFGEVNIMDISLHPQFAEKENSDYFLTDKPLIKSFYKPRDEFAHKGNFGHALIVAGSYGKMGAALLAVNACLRSGAGLTTAFVPACGYDIIQSSLPEAMCITGSNEKFLTSFNINTEGFTSIAIGPGMGTHEKTAEMFKAFMAHNKKPVVIDADGLNCIAKGTILLNELLPYTIITPHPKEFDRLFGDSNNDFERMQKASEAARAWQIIIVLKGHYTAIVDINGIIYFNATGNSGMAKGGSGDALTGVICALLAQQYLPLHAAILGVYLHGLAGDIAVRSVARESLVATDIINNLSAAFKEII